MNRTSFAALALLTSFVTLVAPGCSSTDDGPTGTGGTSTLPTAGTGTLPAAGTPSTGGTSGGASAGGTAAGGTATGGTATGGGGAATGGGGAATGGGGASTGGGGASAGSGGAAGGAGGTAAGGGGAGGGTSDPNCPIKIDSAVVCTAAVTCPNATCGAFKLGVKDCTCAGAVGNFACSSCTYKGGESIVTPPATATTLTACTAADAVLEDTDGCTKGDRCKSLDTTKSRFCACWDDPVKGGTTWDCDAIPSSWPK